MQRFFSTLMAIVTFSFAGCFRVPNAKVPKNQSKSPNAVNNANDSNKSQIPEHSQKTLSNTNTLTKGMRRPQANKQLAMRRRIGSPPNSVSSKIPQINKQLKERTDMRWQAALRNPSDARPALWHTAGSSSGGRLGAFLSVGTLPQYEFRKLALRIARKSRLKPHVKLWADVFRKTTGQNVQGPTIVNYLVLCDAMWHGNAFNSAASNIMRGRIQNVPQNTLNEWASALRSVTGDSCSKTKALAYLIQVEGAFRGQAFIAVQAKRHFARLKSIPRTAIGSWSGAIGSSKIQAAIVLISSDLLFNANERFRVRDFHIMLAAAQTKFSNNRTGPSAFRRTSRSPFGQRHSASKEATVQSTTTGSLPICFTVVRSRKSLSFFLFNTPSGTLQYSFAMPGPTVAAMTWGRSVGSHKVIIGFSRVHRHFAGVKWDGKLIPAVKQIAPSELRLKVVLAPRVWKLSFGVGYISCNKSGAITSVTFGRKKLPRARNKRKKQHYFTVSTPKGVETSAVERTVVIHPVATEDAQIKPVPRSKKLRDKERKAASKLRLAKMFLKRGKNRTAKKWLRKVIKECPKTQSAAEAAKLLRMLY